MNREYKVILRCRSLGTWPSGTWSIGPIGDIQVVTAEGPQMCSISPFVVSYGGSTETEPRKTDLKLWQGDTPKNLLLGNRLFVARGEPVSLEYKVYAPELNELDLGIQLTLTADVEPRMLIQRCAPCLYALVIYLSLGLQDLLTPVAPPQVLETMASGEFLLHFGGTLQAFDRPVHTRERIVEALSTYSAYRRHDSPEEAATIDVAARRYLSAQLETDLMDRFCDLWEACDFLTRRGRQRMYVVERIAAALADHTNKAKAGLRKIIGNMYSIRKDVVHNAIEDEAKVSENLQVLESFAKELIRMRMNMNYEGSPTIDQVVP